MFTSPQHSDLVSRELKIRSSGLKCWLITHITTQLYLVASNLHSDILIKGQVFEKKIPFYYLNPNPLV